MKCCTCNKELFGAGVFCKCKEFFFCDALCFQRRPFRTEHKEICERRKALEIEKLAAQAKLKKKLQSAKNSENQPRGHNGQFGKKMRTPEEEASLTPEELEQKKKQVQHVQANRACNRLRKSGINLQKIKPDWEIKITVARNEKHSKADPVLYETTRTGIVPLSQSSSQHQDVRMEEDYDMEERQIHLEEISGNSDAPDRLLCYICKRKIVSWKSNFRCNGKLEDSTRCRIGAAHGECLNVEWSALSKETMKSVKMAFMCAGHREKNKDHAESGSDDEQPTTNATNPRRETTTKKALPRYNLSKAVSDLIPIEERTSPKTRPDVLKLIKIYVKDQQLEFVKDVEGRKQRTVKPDGPLSLVYGEQDVTFVGLNGKCLSEHLTPTQVDTSILDADAMMEASPLGSPVASGSRIVAFCSRPPTASLHSDRFQLPSTPTGSSSPPFDGSMSPSSDEETGSYSGGMTPLFHS